jgi:hypothetical protein
MAVHLTGLAIRDVGLDWTNGSSKLTVEDLKHRILYRNLPQDAFNIHVTLDTKSAPEIMISPKPGSKLSAVWFVRETSRGPTILKGPAE